MAELNIKLNVEDKGVQKATQGVTTLRNQIKDLQKQIQTSRVGSVEFEQLSEQLKDTQDQLALVNAKSGDLFDSFNRLPGPIGMIGTTIQGTLDDLKILSNFSFKDLGKQFGAIGGDIVQIGTNLAKTTGITKLYTATTLLLSNGLKAVGISASTSSKGLRIFSAALTATGIGAIVVALGLLIANFDKLKAAVLRLVPGLAVVGDKIMGLVNAFTDLIGVTSESERAEERRQETYKKAAAATEILNKAIDREIAVLKAQGATQDEIDAKRKKQINAQLNDLEKAANERGMLYGEQATQYKDLINELEVIDEEAKTRQKEKDKKDADERKQRAQKAAQENLQFLTQQNDAVVQLEKDREDTNEDNLRKALQRQNELRNMGKKMSVEALKLQAIEIEKVIKEELKKDEEARQKAFEERVSKLKEENKLIIDEASVLYENQKILFGETSKEARKAQDEIFAAQQKALEAEKLILEEKKNLTEDEKVRLREIGIEEQNLTNTKIAENKKRLDEDVAAAVASQEAAKAAAQAKYESDIKLAGTDAELQQQLLDEKIKREQDYYNTLLANENLTKEQRKKIQDELTANLKANAEAQIAIETLRFENQQKLLAGTAAAIIAVGDVLGKETAAGKALAVAASLINTYAAIAGQLKAFAGLPIPGYAIVQAVATGLVGFKAVKDIIATPVPSGGAAAAPQPRKLASGGMISGPGSGKSDLIPAMLSNGESVINAKSTSLFRPLLSTINSIGGGKKFAEGGLAVSSFSQEAAIGKLNEQLLSNVPPMRTYVVASDMTNQQMLDRVAKTRSTL